MPHPREQHERRRLPARRAQAGRADDCPQRIHPPYLRSSALRRTGHPLEPERAPARACLKIARGAAAWDYGRGLGGKAGASPQRAVTAEPTRVTGKRPAARRVFAPSTVWFRCSSVTGHWQPCSFVAPRHPVLRAKTAPLGIFRQALQSPASPTRPAAPCAPACAPRARTTPPPAPAALRRMGSTAASAVALCALAKRNEHQPAAVMVAVEGVGHCVPGGRAPRSGSGS